MERQAQVWQIVDPLGNPLERRFPAHALHKLIAAAQGQGTDLYNVDRLGTRTLMEAASGGNSRPHLILHTIRQENLPSEDARGKVIDLSIHADHGLAEGTHFLFCPRNVVICLYNHFGPRPRRLADWLKARAGLDVSFAPLYRTDVWTLIDDMEKLTAVEVSIPADQAANLPAAGDGDGDGHPSVLDALRGAGSAGRGGTIHMTWSVGRGGHAMPQTRMRNILGDIYEARDGGFTVAKAYGRVEGVDHAVPVDLIEDQLVTRKSVEPETSRSRRLSTPSAYEAMDATFKQFKGQIEDLVDPVESTSHMVLPGGLQERSDDDG